MPDKTENGKRAATPFLGRILRMLRMGRGYGAPLSGSMALAALSVGIALVLPLGLRALLDAAIRDRRRSDLDTMALVLFSLYVVRAVLNYAGPVLLRLTGERITVDLRSRLYEHLLGLDVRFFAQHRTGDLVSRLTSDIGSIRSAITELAFSFVLQLLKLAGSVAIMVALNWRLSMVIFAVTPIATLVSRVFRPRIQELSRELQERQGTATAVAQEALAGIRLVKAFHRPGYEADRFRAAMGELFATTKRVVRETTVLQVAVDFIFMSAIVLIFWYGGTEVLARRLTAGDFVAFMFYAQNISQGIGEIIRLYTGASQTVGASDRVFEIFDVQPEIRDAAHPVVMQRARGAIALDGVSFGYDENRDVLHHISFSLEAGEQLAIVGLSGAGKSTLVHLLLRFYDPTAGVIRLDRHDLRTLSVASLREQISIVSQDGYLFAGSVRENIRYGRLDASDAEVERAARAAQIDEFIRDIPSGYNTLVGENGIRLSGGQRQRIAIARALLKNAPVLLLDEATSSIDAMTEEGIRRSLHSLQESRTTITITHRLETVREVPRILVLHDGVIVADGCHDRLMRSCGIYEDLVRRRPEITEESPVAAFAS